jgi:hypothetical protein
MRRVTRNAGSAQKVRSGCRVPAERAAGHRGSVSSTRVLGAWRAVDIRQLLRSVENGAVYCALSAAYW